MLENSGTLNDDLLSQLECPVCYETCVPPIYMCTNGHSICGGCRPQLTRCSLCSEPGVPALRSMQLERIAELVRMPCANQHRGCQFVCNSTDMARHLPACEFGGFECLVCREWKREAQELKSHVSNDHSDRLVNLGLSGETTMNAVFNASYNTDMLVSFNGSLLWVNFKHQLADRVISSSARLVSKCPKEASKFVFSLEFYSCNTALKVLYQGPVLALTEDARKDRTDFVIPADIINSYPGERVSFTLKIIRVLNPPTKRRKYFFIGLVAFVVVAYVWNKKENVIETDVAEEIFRNLWMYQD